MSRMFSDLKVININSRYEGWLTDLGNIVREVGKKEFMTKSAPSVPWELFRERLQELKYVCLLNDLTLHRAYSLRGTEGSANEWDDFFSDIMPAEEPDFNEHRTDETLHRSREAHKRVPNHQGSSIIDCYGIYVSSLKSWLSSNQISEATDDCLLYDGPAILLCPELIEGIYRLTTSGLRLDRNLGLQINPTKTFLKQVFLHELGHHIYQVKNDRTLSEAMANWFCYGFLSYEEKRFLYKKTSTQDDRYRAYEGFLALSYPWTLLPRSSWGLIDLGPRNNMVMGQLEEACFAGSNLKSPYDFEHWFYTLHSLFYESKNVFDPSLRAATYLLYGLSNKSTYNHYRRYLSPISGKWATSDEQYRWREKVWNQPRLTM